MALKKIEFKFRGKTRVVDLTKFRWPVTFDKPVYLQAVNCYNNAIAQNMSVYGALYYKAISLASDISGDRRIVVNNGAVEFQKCVASASGKGNGAWDKEYPDFAKVGEVRYSLAQNIFGGGYVRCDGTQIQGFYPGLDLPVIPSDGSNWKASPLNAGFSRFVYGAGLMAGISLGEIYTSPDGMNWTQRAVASGSFVDIIYNNGMFVAVNDEFGSSRIFTSTDGVAWTGQSRYFLRSSVAYGNGKFVCVANNQLRTFTSPDGYSWTVREDALPFPALSIAFGNGVFVVRGMEYRVATSTDGVNWTEGNPVSTFSSYSRLLVFGNGVFITEGQGGKINTSTDGVSWTESPVILNDSNTNKYMDFCDGVFIKINHNSQIAKSTDGVNWTAVPRPVLIGIIDSAIYKSGSFIVCMQDKVYCSFATLTLPDIENAWLKIK
ncbi:MAG: hypothetical protein LBG92_10475 [Prevotellaceae bacterium]|jgi:hypothetical protein|nr:hypothetical protein [Prevotellaceae bacterium]